MNVEILKTIESRGAIPSLPNIVLRLIEVTNDPNFKQADVVKLLSTDPGIVTDLLRLANSSLFGGRQKITSLADAFTRLGVRRVRTLIVGRSMISCISNDRSILVDTSYFWRRSLATAVLASRFASKLAPDSRDQAFLGGLLCDVGVIVLSRAYPDKYEVAARNYAPLAGDGFISQEVELVGITHAEVSAEALRQWMLPPELADAIRLHHTENPAGVAPGVATIARIINGGSDIARLLCEVAKPAKIASVCRTAMAHVGLPTAALAELLPTVESDISELAAALRVDVIPSRVYRILAEGMAEQLAAAG
ncbi:MAG: HDOD domain-containing protein [Phycisphaerales bacterium]|nr:HDOD domain-containing protein [Phycisphaerales bacterium]